MVLSATQAHLAADAAKAEGFVFVPLVDGRVPMTEWQSALMGAMCCDRIRVKNCLQ